MRARFILILAVGLATVSGGCTELASPTKISPTSSTSSLVPAITSLVITGLPEPLLFDIPPSVKAGRSYTVGATVGLDDGSAAVARALSVTWSTTDPTVASVTGNILQAHREGAIRLVAASGGFTASRDLTVRGSAAIVREERAQHIPCTRLVCPYPFCPWEGPYWLFPVYESGPIELISVKNPGWGSPTNHVTQLSPKGERLKSWNLGLPKDESDTYPKTVSVPGGFMYVFTMGADLLCGGVAAAAVWTHPN